MTTTPRRLMHGLAAFAAIALLAGCGLPRSGPTRDEIFSGSVLREGDAFILDVDDRVNQIASIAPAYGFSSAFLDAGELGSDTIHPGDVLGLTIWENVDDGLLVPSGANATVLDQVQVDGAGFIFVPYAGRILAAGNTPEAIRRIIVNALAEQTPDPQVQVRRLAGNGSTVSIDGLVGASGVYPIEQPTRTLAAMIARAGGVTAAPEIAQVTVVRGGQEGTIWYSDLYDHPQNDIALRAGDQILIEADGRSFTALGATGMQTEMTFETRTISAIEALARLGGLNARTADPTGVFVFRTEPEEIARRLTGEESLRGPQRVIYVLDLTRPNGVFFARDFAIRDGDTVYVTEAPFSQFSKVISAITGTLTSANSLNSAASALAGG